MTTNNEYVEHYLNTSNVFPSVLALKLFMGNNPNFSFKEHELKGKKILDIGFGDGRDLYLFNHLNMDVYGVEPDERVVKHTQDKLRKLGFTPKLKTGHNNNTGLDNNTFDIIYASSSIYYLSSLEDRIIDALSHCYDILKTDGYFVGSMCRSDCFVTDEAVKLDENRLILEDPYFKFRKGQHYHVYNSQDEIRCDLMKCGFKVVSLSDYDVDWFGSRETLFLFVAQKSDR
ncbi:MAG: methyltransferase domain-containing protein [Halopseudomonas aestusnigri]